MNKKIVKTVLFAYSKIRRLIEPIMFTLFSQKISYDKEKWEFAKKLGINEFEKYIDKFAYKSDKMAGLFDMSFPINKPEYFFANLDWGRDCDDYARIWAIYLKRTNEWNTIKECIVLDSNHPFFSAHVVTTAKNKASGKYWLFNYKMIGPYETEEQAIKGCITERNTSFAYNEENFMWIKYREI